MGKITDVILGEDYLLMVCFDNSHSVTIDMKKKLHTARFSELRNRDIFQAAKTDGKSVLWPGGISISISELIEIITK